MLMEQSVHVCKAYRHRVRIEIVLDTVLRVGLDQHDGPLGRARIGEAVDEIGWRVGYEDPAFFRRLFKRITGVSPAGYRRQFQFPPFAADSPRASMPPLLSSRPGHAVPEFCPIVCAGKGEEDRPGLAP